MFNYGAQAQHNETEKYVTRSDTRKPLIESILIPGIGRGIKLKILQYFKGIIVILSYEINSTHHRTPASGLCRDCYQNMG